VRDSEDRPPGRQEAGGGFSFAGWRSYRGRGASSRSSLRSIDAISVARVSNYPCALVCRSRGRLNILRNARLSLFRASSVQLNSSPRMQPPRTAFVIAAFVVCRNNRTTRMPKKRLDPRALAIRYFHRFVSCLANVPPENLCAVKNSLRSFQAEHNHSLHKGKRERERRNVQYPERQFSDFTMRAIIDNAIARRSAEDKAGYQLKRDRQEK